MHAICMKDWEFKSEAQHWLPIRELKTDKCTRKEKKKEEKKKTYAQAPTVEIWLSL